MRRYKFEIVLVLIFLCLCAAMPTISEHCQAQTQSHYETIMSNSHDISYEFEGNSYEFEATSPMGIFLYNATR